MIPAAVVECYSCVPACVSLSLFAALRFQSQSKKPPPACEQHPHVSSDGGAAEPAAAACSSTSSTRCSSTPATREKLGQGRVTPDDELYDGMVAPDDKACGVLQPAPQIQATATALAPCESHGSEAGAAQLDVRRSQHCADVGPVFHSSVHLLRDTSTGSLGDWELVDPYPATSIANASKRSEHWSSIRDAGMSEAISAATCVSPRAKVAERFPALQKYLQCISNENDNV